MLSAESVGLAIKIVNGLIKLTKRLDLIIAEKEAVEEPLVIPVPDVSLAPTQPQMRKALRKLLKDTKNDDPDPLGDDREKILKVVDVQPQNIVLFDFMQTYLPEQALGRVLSPDGAFMTAFREQHPDMAADPDVRVTAFYVGAGRDFRNKNYTWRIALTVVDVLAEFGGENMALFTCDERVQKIVGAILKRFGETDVQKTDSTRELLRAALRATLNGVFNAREAFEADSKWIDALFDALANARDAVPVAQRDDFLVGLVRGEGYPLLVGAFLETAAGILNDDAAEDFKDVAAHFLNEIAALIKKEPTFEDFLQDHWGDLLRAGLKSLAKHGPALIEDESALLEKVLVSVVGELANLPDSKFLSSDALVGIVEAAVGAVAASPELIKEIIDQKWLTKFIESIAVTVAGEGIRKTFTQEGLESLVRDLLGTFAEHPELIIEEPGLTRQLLGGVLASISEAKTFAAEALASAAVGGALIALAENPSLIKFEYPRLVAALAGKIGILVQEKKLIQVQAVDILAALTATPAENPALFLDVEKGLAAWTVEAVVAVSEGNHGDLLAGLTLTRVLHEILSAIAQSGKAALKNHPAAQFAEQLENLLEAGLSRAEKELGNLMGLPSLPAVLSDLVTAWARGEIASLDPDNDNFRRLFSELAESAAA